MGREFAERNLLLLMLGLFCTDGMFAACWITWQGQLTPCSKTKESRARTPCHGLLNGVITVRDMSRLSQWTRDAAFEPPVLRQMKELTAPLYLVEIIVCRVRLRDWIGLLVLLRSRDRHDIRPCSIPDPGN